MVLFRFLWLRSLIRRNTNPIPEHQAEKWRKRLTYAYVLCAWQAFGIVMYLVYQGKGDWAAYYGLKSKEEMALTPAQQWTKTLGIKKATVYRISGLNVSKYDINNDTTEEAASEAVHSNE